MNVSFTATGIHDAVTQLVVTQQPSNAFSNSPFGTQPMITLRDQYANTATTASGSVTLSVVSGCGAITGTATAAINSGVAVFSTAGCSTAGAAVIRASFGAITVNSASFTVLALPPGACVQNDAFFTTADGGCKDLTSGLTWSAKSASTMTWYAAIWDSVSVALNANTIDAGDYGRTNDYGGSPNVQPDNSTTDYCHDLSEGGQTDWRVPTLAELQGVYTNSNAGGRTPPYLNTILNENLWSSETGNHINKMVFNLSNGSSSQVGSASNLNVYCVRGGRTAPDRLTITAKPVTIGTNSSTALVVFPITVQVQDSLLNSALVQGLVATVSTNLGTIGGTTTATTDATGIATFTGFTLDTAGTATLTFSATGMTSTTMTIKVGAFPHTCTVEDAAFVTAEGGCKQVGTGKIWSLPASWAMTWHDAIWGYTAGVFNLADPPDADDGARTNDYDPATVLVGHTDTSGTNYCHSLVQGGYTDWRVPTVAELQTVAVGQGPSSHFNARTTSYFNQNFISSTSAGSNSANFIACNLTGCASPAQAGKSTGLSLYCIRP